MARLLSGPICESRVGEQRADSVLTLGIDLAAQNKKTVACLIEWRDQRAVVRELVSSAALDDGVDWMVELVHPSDGPAPDAVGIDAPFGWPVAMLEAVSAWSVRERWPSPPKRDFRFRATDVAVWRETQRWPLSVSTDLIAITTLRCVALLDVIAQRRGLTGGLSRTGSDGVFEIYPGAALTQWGLKRAGYKSDPAARTELVAELERACTAGPSGSSWLDLGATRERAIASDDALDAVLASLSARAAAIGETVQPSALEATLGEIEGWIHLPLSGSLALLAAA